ncbi:GrpB family protein [Oceanobacillus sp. M60]
MKIRLSEYNEKWIEMFENEVRLLSGVFGSEIIKFEHFGSTAVKGMKAKPVIDMICIVKDINKMDAFNDQMRLPRYDVAGEWGIKNRRLFRKSGENRTHHIHVYQYNNPEVERHLVFRDYLRNHPIEAERYSNLKEELAIKYDDTTFYSKAKRTFVERVEQRALNWFRNK